MAYELHALPWEQEQAYLEYQNRRTDYVETWWNVVDGTAINKRLAPEMVGVAK